MVSTCCLRRGAERGGQEDAGGPGQTGRGDLCPRGQGQGRRHFSRGVLRTQARRVVEGGRRCYFRPGVARGGLIVLVGEKGLLFFYLSPPWFLHLLWCKNMCRISKEGSVP